MIFEGKKLRHSLACADEDKLRQAAKFLTPVNLDQLVAGIAHEIKSSVQYVADSISFLGSAFEDLLAIHAKYQEAAELPAGSPAQQQVLGEIARAEKEADLSFLREQLPKAFECASQGIAEITSLVQSMKEAAHSKNLDKRPADINKALLQVLTLARNEYKYALRVTTELGQLPPVACHVGQLSKILLALVVNLARAATGARGRQGELGEIAVRTAYEAGAAWIEIENADAGLAEKSHPQHLHNIGIHLSDSPVGPTAKHGLDMARSIIVDDHSGELTFEIGTEHGTAFLIRLPVDGKSLAQIGV